MNDRPVCRLCRSADVENLGSIPQSDFFAGRALQAGLDGGHLWLCATCGSMCRHPILPWPRYVRLYEQGSAEQWHDGNRNDLQVVRSIIAAERPCCSVLDVGCSAGYFLASLPPEHARFGIEPSTAAAAKATADGVSVIARSLEELPPDALFDVISIIDVIEHVPEPGGMLQGAYAHLAPGGLLIISTGDPEYGPWRRLFKARFWYSSFPEHLSFPSFRFFRSWGMQQQAAAVVKRAIHARRPLPVWQKATGFLMQSAYLASPSAFNCVARLIASLFRVVGLSLPRRRHYSPAIPGLLKDHQVVTIRRP